MIHELVFHVTALWLIILVGVCTGTAARTRSQTTRALLVDLLTLIIVALLLLWSVWQEVSHFVDAAIVLALLSFAATLAAARFLAKGRIFE